MDNFQLQQLIKIYNTMTTISTKGEDTLTMADCLRAFRSVIFEIQKQHDEPKEQQGSFEIEIPLENIPIKE